MKTRLFGLATLCAGLAFAAPVIAHEVVANSTVVVPEAEKERAQELLADGPQKTSGIGGVNLLGAVSLEGEFSSSDGLSMRVRELVINPGGIVAVHEHNNRPGVAYIIEGEMIEHRSSEGAGVAKPAGSVALERTGVIHWWENTGTVPARALVVDIVEAE